MPQKWSLIILIPFILVFFGCVVVIISISSVLQASTLPWPSRPRAPDGNLYESGWIVSRGYAWETFNGQATWFHDGIGITNPSGNCPFGPRCEVVSMTDGVVAAINHDERRGQTVWVVNGDNEFVLTYGRLEPYRHYVRLEGRVYDPYGRYPEFEAYAPIGSDPLIPGSEAIDIEIQCRQPSPTFTLVQSGATMVFEYDSPGQCVTRVIWGQRSDDWEGWNPTSPTSLAWQTAIQGEGSTARALDVGVRFRAEVIPPPPPPTPVPTVTATSVAINESTSRHESSMFFGLQYERRNEEEVRFHHRSSLRIGDSCRPDQHACRWRVERAAALLTSHQADESEPPRLGVILSPEEGPVINRGGETALLVVATSSRYPIRLSTSVIGGDVRTLASLQPSCQNVSLSEAYCARAPDGEHAAGSSVFRLLVRADASAQPGARVTVRVVMSHERWTDEQEVALIVREAPTPSPAAYPPPGEGDDIGDVIDIPIVIPTPVGYQPPPRIDCSPQQLVSLPGVVNANGGTGNMMLAERAAVSFQRVRNEIIRQTGQDPLQRLADGLRSPEFRSSKPGVALYSWHMTGRAIDVDLSYPWTRVRDGQKWRLYIGATDITAIFERHGWRRIPDRNDSPEWWHYEFTEGLSWRTAMRQVWTLSRLQQAFPEIPWESVGCTADPGNPGEELTLAEAVDRCTVTQPLFDGDISSVPGCGPPVDVGMVVYQLTHGIGFVAGPDLYVGLQRIGVNGHTVFNACAPQWLAGASPPDDPSRCWVDREDPLAFLPRNHDGQPAQLKPPDSADEYVFGTTIPPSGQYWSPNPQGGPYGGNRVGGGW